MRFKMQNFIKFVSAAAVVVGLSATSAQAIPMTNLALGGTASQSSDYQGNVARNGAQKAIDGNTFGNWVNSNLNTITHTNNDRGAWWEVDLGSVMHIDSITIWNRTDCCLSRTRDFNVLVDGAVKGTWSNQSGPNPSTTFSNINTNGQVVRVQLNVTDYLHLAEVQVFGLRLPQNQVSEPAGLALLAGGLLFGLHRRRKTA